MKTAEQIAREILESLTAVNQYMGYQFTQPLTRATEEISRAITAARDEAIEECAKLAEYSYWGHSEEQGDRIVEICAADRIRALKSGDKK